MCGFALAKLPVQPQQVFDIAVVDSCRELHFDRNDSAVSTFDDKINFMSAVADAEVPGGCLGSLGVDPDRQRCKRLEERAQEGAVSNRWRSWPTVTEQSPW